MDDQDNPITDFLRGILGWLITPLALLILGASNVLHTMTGWRDGVCYAVAFLSPIVVGVSFIIIRWVIRCIKGDR